MLQIFSFAPPEDRIVMCLRAGQYEDDERQDIVEFWANDSSWGGHEVNKPFKFKDGRVTLLGEPVDYNKVPNQFVRVPDFGRVLFFVCAKHKNWASMVRSGQKPLFFSSVFLNEGNDDDDFVRVVCIRVSDTGGCCDTMCVLGPYVQPDGPYNHLLHSHFGYSHGWWIGTLLTRVWAVGSCTIRTIAYGTRPIRLTDTADIENVKQVFVQTRREVALRYNVLYVIVFAAGMLLGC